ncbi:MAG: AAA family ATPase [Archangium sp.]|nr:AAA family ATPase [Archangium sp.]MDP3569875.1 AAA family ATPase [Archangium sp.]
MLTRLYVDNYKTLVDFEFKPTKLCVLVGENGSGKTNIGSVLHALTRLIVEGHSAEDAFPSRNLCRWSNSDVQTVKVDVRGMMGEFRYELRLRHDKSVGSVTVESERLLHLDETVFRSDAGTVSLFGGPLKAPEDPSPKPTATFPFDRRRSFLSTGDVGSPHVRSALFRATLQYLRVLKPDPSTMLGRSEHDSPRLERNANNLASWYRWFAQNLPERLNHYFEQLSAVLPGFRTLRAVDAGTDAKEVRAVFAVPSGGELSFSLEFLSEGQRQLLMLYLLLEAVGPWTTLYLDEPDNFISIREVQPWLSELERVLDERGAQAIIVSHGTEAMNYLGSRQAFVVTRPGGGATRIASHDGSDGSMPSEVVLYGSSTGAEASK